MHPERGDWHEVPGRDEQWKYDTIKSLGSKDAFDQEFGNKFIETGESVVDEDLAQKFNIDIRKPKYIYEEGNYHIWIPPNKDNIYVAGVDIGEGVNEAGTVIQILDITDLTNIEQVAIYHNNQINLSKVTLLLSLAVFLEKKERKIISSIFLQNILTLFLTALRYSFLQ